MDNWDGYGVYNPDLENQTTWYDFIGVEDGEQEIWNETTQEWETDVDYDPDEDDNFESMDALEARAKASIKLRKAAFDKLERKIRKDNTCPDWVSRVWFYMSTFESERENEILSLEKAARVKDRMKKRKAGRAKLFKRLNKRFKR